MCSGTLTRATGGCETVDRDAGDGAEMGPGHGEVAGTLVERSLAERVARRKWRSRADRSLSREVKRIMRSGDIREAVDAIVDPNAIAREASDRGDAYRALRSLLDAVERDRALDVDVATELEARVRDLVQSLG